MFNEAMVTNAGLAIYNQWLGGAALTLTGAKGGSTVSANPAAATDLVNTKQTLTLLDPEPVDGGQRVRVQVTSVGLTSGYILRQVGIWGKIGSGTPVLLMLLQSARGVPVPAEADNPDFVFTLGAFLQAVSSGSFSAVIDPQALVSRETMTAAISAHNTSAAAHQDIRLQLTSPFNFKGDVADMTALNAIQNPAQNDTYYVVSLMCRYSWTGTAWAQSSLDESEYEDNLSDLKSHLTNIENVENIVEASQNVNETTVGVIRVNIESGKQYVISADAVASDGTSADGCRIAFMSSNDNELWYSYFKRQNTYQAIEFTAPSDAVKIWCYADNTYSNSIGKSITITKAQVARKYELKKRIDGIESDIDVIESDIGVIESDIGGIEASLYNGAEKIYTPIMLDIQNGKQAQLNWDASVMSIASGGGSLNLGILNITDETRLRVYCTANGDFKTESGYICMNGNTVLSYYAGVTYGNYLVEFDVPAGCTAVYINGQNITPTAEKVATVPAKFAYSKEESDEKYLQKPYCDLSLFPSFGVVGDSFASGELYYNNSYTDHYNISWGQIMARRHGTTCVNYAKGGLSTRTWLTDANGLTLMNSSPANDIYYLALGINDEYQLGPSYLGDITDITDYESYIDYGDTFYGNYGRIIEQILLHASHAKLVMFTMAHTSIFNNAIIEIAEHYNIPYIVQLDDNFFSSDTYTKMAGSHPRAVAYSGMACAFERLLNKCIIDKWDYFKDCFMYDDV